MTDATVRGTDHPLQAPATFAQSLVDIAVAHGDRTHADAVALVRSHIAEDESHVDPTLWMVEGHDGPMSAAAYSGLVLAELDRLA